MARIPTDDEIALPPRDPNAGRPELPGEGGGPEGDHALDDAGLDEVDLDGTGEGEQPGAGGAEAEAELALPEQEGLGRQRANDRVRALREQAQREAERANALERELMQQRARQEELARQQNERSEEEQLAALPWEQQVEYRMRRDREVHRQELQRMQFQNVVNQDKLAFDARAAADPQRRRVAQQVEQVYAQAIQSGRYIPREDVYAYVRGRELLEREAQQPKRRVQAPSAQRQTVRAPDSRSNQAVGRRGGNESLQQREARLGDITF